MEAEAIQTALRRSVLDLSNRGLVHAAKWSAEMLQSLDKSPTPANMQHIQTLTDKELLEMDTILFAKCCFDAKEFDRAAHILQNCTSDRALFLKLYSKFLSGEKKKEDESVEFGDQQVRIKNKELPDIRRELETLIKAQADPFLLYLHGLVLVKLQLKKEAIPFLIQSVCKYPCNWSAWLELVNCISSFEMVSGIAAQITESFMKEVFLTQAFLEFHQSEAAVTKLTTQLIPVFPKFCFLKRQQALAHYSMRDFDKADSLFQAMSSTDPYNLEFMEPFSHVLYVKEDGPRLSFLAHNAVKIDKYRSETCLIVGNFYSLRVEHEKAIVYFKRALKLNPSSATTWILLGHEFLEIKNANVAIEAYRRALDANQRDYRAWYGLGQAYELLKMPFYTLYYYQKATSLRPYDTRLWGALGKVYEELDRLADAAKCYERAIDQDGNALFVLARLYKKLKNYESATFYFEQFVALREQEGSDTPELPEVYLYLGQYYQKTGNFQLAQHYLSKNNSQAGSEQEEAKARLREINSTLGLPNQASAQFSANKH